MKPISEQLREARKVSNLTQRELAEKAFITLDTINRIEKQRTQSVYVYTLQQLQKVLNIKFEI